MSEAMPGLTPAEFIELYEAALCARDLEALAVLIADDAIFFFSNETSHVGKSAILLAIKANFEAIANEAYTISHLTWLAAGDQSALCVYDFEWSGEINGISSSGRGRGTTALRRAGEEWRIIHEHLSRGRLFAR